MKEETKKRPGKLLFVVIAILIVAGVLSLYLGNRSSSGVQAWEPIVLTKENLPSHLSQYSAINDLPKDSAVAFTIGSAEYGVNKGQVTEGIPSNPDVSIKVPEKYFEIIGQQGWCAGLATANAAGDLNVEMHISSAAAAWKYKSMFKYKNCLG